MTNDVPQNIALTEIDLLQDDNDNDNATETVIPTTTSTPGATNLMFRGLPVRIDEDAAAASHLEINRRTTQRRNIRGTDDNIDNRSRPNMRVDRAILFQDGLEGTPHTQATQHSARTTTSASTTLRYGSETFEEYMQQFMSSEVRYKDFRKASFQKFDSSQQDSFIH